jgi:probable HAF family extracellular repeat protein
MPLDISLLNFKLLAVPGANQMTANDINDHGQVVGEFTDPHGVTHGFLCKDESFCQLDYPNAQGTSLLGINNLGQILGSFMTLTGTAGFLYDRGTFSPPLTYPGSGNLTIPNGINDRGEFVGVFQDATPGDHGFYCKAGQYGPLAYPGARETSPQGINDGGQVVGDFPDATGTHGFVYLENVGVFTTALNCAAGSNMALRGINNGGQIVGGCFDARGNEHPFLYVAGALHSIPIPGATTASVNGINDLGQIVGNFQSQTGAHSFLAAVPV